MRKSDNYPHVPHAKEGSPQTAFDAAKAIKDKAAAIREQAFSHVNGQAGYGATGQEVAAALGLHKTQVRSRLSELQAAGRIVESGRKRMGDSGVNVTVWVVPEYGPPKPVDPQLSLPVAA